MTQKMQRAFGKRVRDLRKSRGWTQEQMAHTTGLHWSYIGQAERGERNLTLLTLSVIAKAFKMKVSELLRGID